MINQIEPIETDNKTYRPIKSLFFWPLGFAFILSLFAAIVQHKKRIHNG